MTWRDVHVLIGRRCTLTALKQAYRMERDRQAARATAALRGHRSKERSCLRCRAKFLSQHAGNRLCDPCRADIAQLAPDMIFAHAVGA